MNSSSTLAGRTPRNKKNYLVIDMDVHVNETPDDLMPYCELPWRKILEGLKGVPYRYLDIPCFAPNYTNIFPSFPDTGGDRRKTVTSVAQMRADLDDLGVDICVIFPDALLTLAAIRQDDYAVALARAYNRWLVDKWLSEDNGFFGAVIAPHQNPLAAAEEIRKYAGHKFIKAIYLPTSCVEPLYGHRRYDPVYEAAQETNLPVVFHSVTAVHPNFPFNLHGFNTNFGAHALGHPFSLVANLVHMIESAVPVRFPKLRIGFTEAGISWVPWIMMRLDKEYAERRRDVPLLKDRPSTYIRQMFFSTQPIEEPEHAKDMVTVMSLFGGEDSVMFASDWPHHDFDHPSKVLQIPVTEEVRHKIMGKNAMRLLNVKEGVIR